MNTGIKNKLNELIGKEVNYFDNSDCGVFSISYPYREPYSKYKVLRIEDDDCVVLQVDDNEEFVSIDHISSLTIRK
jgi:hypothetical protein